jgi:ankyrin repeat protein
MAYEFYMDDLSKDLKDSLSSIEKVKLNYNDEKSVNKSYLVGEQKFPLLHIVISKINRVDLTEKNMEERDYIGENKYNDDEYRLMVVKYLLSIPGINLSLLDYSMKTPLHIAVLYMDRRIVKELLEMESINVNAKDVSGKTPVSLVLKELSMGNVIGKR